MVIKSIELEVDISWPKNVFFSTGTDFADNFFEEKYSYYNSDMW